MEPKIIKKLICISLSFCVSLSLFFHAQAFASFNCKPKQRLFTSALKSATTKVTNVAAAALLLGIVAIILYETQKNHAPKDDGADLPKPDSSQRSRIVEEQTIVEENQSVQQFVRYSPDRRMIITQTSAGEPPLIYQASTQNYGLSPAPSTPQIPSESKSYDFDTAPSAPPMPVHGFTPEPGITPMPNNPKNCDQAQ